MRRNSSSETIGDRIDIARASALLATVGAGTHAETGSVLPPLSHHAFFWEPVPESGLGPDGHPGTGSGLIPDVGLPIRMWAGGRVTFHAPFRAGVRAERTARLAGVARKEGRSGRLAIVTLRTEVHQRGAPVLTEDQDILYREARPIESDPPVETGEADERRALKLSAVTLFRYSALTFNAHRIHYDADYARELGYPGLVVHGPLLAMRLAMFAEERLGPLSRFEFRATAPLFLGDVAWLCREGERYWIEGPRRRVCMTAVAG